MANKAGPVLGPSERAARLKKATEALAEQLHEPVHRINTVAYMLRWLTHSQHRFCVDAGWYTDAATGQPKERNVGEMLSLVHAEVSEALEGYRKGLSDEHLPHRMSIEVELADAVLRIADLAGYLGLDIGKALVEKWEYNTRRIDHTPSHRGKAGGKQF